VKRNFLPSDGKFYLVLVYILHKKYNLWSLDGEFRDVFFEQKYKQLFEPEEPFYLYKFGIWLKPFFTELFLIFWKKIYGLDNHENIDYVPKVAKVCCEGNEKIKGIFKTSAEPFLSPFTCLYLIETRKRE